MQQCVVFCPCGGAIREDAECVVCPVSGVRYSAMAWLNAFSGLVPDAVSASYWTRTRSHLSVGVYGWYFPDGLWYSGVAGFPSASTNSFVANARRNRSCFFCSVANQPAILSASRDMASLYSSSFFQRIGRSSRLGRKHAVLAWSRSPYRTQPQSQSPSMDLDSQDRQQFSQSFMSRSLSFFFSLANIRFPPMGLASLAAPFSRLTLHALPARERRQGVTGRLCRRAGS